MADELVSQTEFGKRTGRSRQAVAKLIKSGKIPTTKKGKQTLIPFEQAVAALDENIDPAQVAGGNAAGSAKTPSRYAEVRTAQMAIKVQESRLDLEKKRGRLVDRDMATRRAFEFAREFRDAMLNFPARYSSLIAAELGVDPAKVDEALNKRLKDYLGKLADRRIGL